MSSLYDLSVPTFLQTVRAMSAVLEKADTHCEKLGISSDEFVTASLCKDMAPFWFQIECVDNYSVWGIEALKTGDWTPPDLAQAVPFADLQARVAGSGAALEAFSSDEVNACSGKELDISITHISSEPTLLTSETFVLSFLLPNFFFHAVTAYDILRAQGVPLGKRDFEGKLRTRSSMQSTD